MTLIVFQGSVYANTVEGRVKTVDVGSKRLEISSITDSTWITYTPTTKWPEGVTDPSILAGRNVEITTDEGGSTALSVED